MRSFYSYTHLLSQKQGHHYCTTESAPRRRHLRTEDSTRTCVSICYRICQRAHHDGENKHGMVPARMGTPTHGHSHFLLLGRAWWRGGVVGAVRCGWVGRIQRGRRGGMVVWCGLCCAVWLVDVGRIQRIVVVVSLWWYVWSWSFVPSRRSTFAPNDCCNSVFAFSCAAPASVAKKLYPPSSKSTAHV